MIIPLRVSVQAQMPLLAADSEESEILIAADRTQAIGVGTSTIRTPINMRTDNIQRTVTTVQQVHTADLAPAPVMSLELARAVKIGDVQGVAATTMWTDLAVEYEPPEPPFLIGPATLLGYWGGTVATTGFAQVVWAELPRSAII